MTAAIELQGLGKRFRLYSDKNITIKTAVLRGGRASYQDLWAVRDVTFDVPTGTTFGLIGRNGSGKSTLLRCLARILRADEGTMRVHGRVAALLELGAGFHPELTGRQNVYLNGTILGMKRRDLERRFDELVAFAGLEDSIDQPVRNYSSGMYARLGFAVATSVDPDVLLVDEVLAVGDVGFQRRCIERIETLRNDGRSVVIVSHDAAVVRRLCDGAAWLDRGVLRQSGPVDDVVDGYLRFMAEDRQEVAGASHRWGTGDVVLSDVALLTAEGKPISVAPAGQPVSIQLTWVTERPVANLVIGLGLWAEDGTHLWGANTGDRGLVMDGHRSTGRLTVTLPRLMLQPGRFRIDAAAHDSSGAHTYDYRREVLVFTVEDSGARESGGYVSLMPQWTVE